MSSLPRSLLAPGPGGRDRRGACRRPARHHLPHRRRHHPAHLAHWHGQLARRATWPGAVRFHRAPAHRQPRHEGSQRLGARPVQGVGHRGSARAVRDVARMATRRVAHRPRGAAHALARGHHAGLESRHEGQAGDAPRRSSCRSSGTAPSSWRGCRKRRARSCCCRRHSRPVGRRKIGFDSRPPNRRRAWTRWWRRPTPTGPS